MLRNAYLRFVQGRKVENILVRVSRFPSPGFLLLLSFKHIWLAQAAMSRSFSIHRCEDVHILKGFIEAERLLFTFYYA